MTDATDPKGGAGKRAVDQPAYGQPSPAAARMEYEVGYGKPPAEFQYGKGQSGNKKGRPRGSRSFKTELREVIEQNIPVTENGRKRNMTARKAMLIRLRQKALSGDQKAIDRLLKLTIDHIPDEVARDDGATAAEDRALLDELKADLRRDPGTDAADDC
ncbi:MAG: DUF5681 domain-containing protein [Janthinobacterium lividum]